MNLQHVVDEVVAGTPGVRWSISLPGLAEHSPGLRLRTASVGKLLLLAETARRFETGELDPAEPLRRDPGLAVADSGLWHLLAVDTLPAADVAALIAAVSDNYATNVLLERVGLQPLAVLAGRLGLRETALLDRVRVRREPHHPATLSTGCAGELAGLMRHVADGTLISPGVSRRMRDWLGTNTDLSMVASAWHADPLWHPRELGNKTGTDDGIRADVGVRGRQAYAVLANWDHAEGDRTAEVLDGMRAIGTTWQMLDRTGSGR
ncbi:serine hydrolase [Paractinoplanes deccanensis]|uniref:Serine hydrolase n=1 Tax=Paractinoplanes deccanensis TaxID=113561 RepID=A0ABQ3YH15_9ACTN|nr:serine hydrolase [Actinoplanes deccanensis]GID79291.1 serine hydrolase [Actinoplanes deccanensis]